MDNSDLELVATNSQIVKAVVRDPGSLSCCCKAHQNAGLTIMRQLFRAVRSGSLLTLDVSTRRTNEFGRSLGAACLRQVQVGACFILAGTEIRL